MRAPLVVAVVACAGACAASAPTIVDTHAVVASTSASSASSAASTSASPSASIGAAPSASIVVAPLPSIADRTFTLEKRVSFASGPTATQKLVAKHTHFSGASADLQTFVVGANDKGLLVTPAAPKGLAWSAQAPQGDGARFSADGSKVAVMQILGPLVVLSTSDAKTIWQRPTPTTGECEARFVSNDRLVFHAMSKESKAQLWSVDLASGEATTSGLPLGVDACTASIDGTRWLTFVDFEDGQPTSAIRLRDATSGVVTELVRRVASTWVLSPVADRACWFDRSQFRLFCRRSSDLALEEILSGAEVQGLEIDDTGARMLIGTAVAGDDGEPRAVMYLADFAAGTVRKIEGVGVAEGGTLHPLSGGHVVASGSATGVALFDVDKAKRSFVKRAGGTIVHPLPGESHRFVLGAEAEGATEDLYLVTLP